MSNLLESVVFSALMNLHGKAGWLVGVLEWSSW